MGIVKYDSNRLSVRMIADRFEKGVLNLEPVFQRQSVWRITQRTHLLDSIFNGYPIPSIFLYRHVDEANGQAIFEVIDGKQRLESLFMYMGQFGAGGFPRPFNSPIGNILNLLTGADSASSGNRVAWRSISSR